MQIELKFIAMEDKKDLQYKNLGFVDESLSNYCVTTYGDVINMKTGRVLKGSLQKGYKAVILKGKPYRVHRLVAMAFLPCDDFSLEVNHKDECKTNNHVDNLEWCSGRYNIEYSKLNTPVDKYTKQGEYVCSYWSMSEAFRDVCGHKNLKTSEIKHCCEGHKDFFKGFRWTYKGETLHPLLKPLLTEEEKKERQRERARAYALAHPKPKKEPKPKKPKMTKEEEKEKRHLHYLANKEKYKNYCKEWRQNNPDKWKELYVKRTAKKYGMTPEEYLANKPEKKLTQQHRDNIKKGVKAMIHKICKPVVQLTLDGKYIRTWDSMSDVKRELGISTGNISTCCKGKRKDCHGYKWMYLSDYNKEGTVA